MLLFFNNNGKEGGEIEKLLLYTGIFFTALLLIQVILTLIGIDSGSADIDMDFDVHTDVDIDFDSNDGNDLQDSAQFSVFSFKSIVSFFAILSWTALTCIQAGLSHAVSMFIGFIAGLAAMYLVARLFFALSKLKQDNTMQIKNAVGQKAEVYLTIPANRSGTGKVNINLDGTLRELEAVSDEEIKTGSIVTVSEILNNSILIVKQ